MSHDTTKPKAFQHVDGGLTEQLQANVVDTSRPMLERMFAGVALMATRGLLDEANKTGHLLPGSAPAAKPLPTSLPAPTRVAGE